MDRLMGDEIDELIVDLADWMKRSMDRCGL